MSTAPWVATPYPLHLIYRPAVLQSDKLTMSL